MSDLLNQASLVMVPSGYKEDTVYSVVPSDGSGDMAFTRASNGTRINSAGLVEVCPWNILQYSEDFANAYWQKGGAPTMNYNIATAPNGTMTADSIQANSAGVYQSIGVDTSISPNSTVTLSYYIKKETTKTYFSGTYLYFSGGTTKITYIIFDEVNGTYNIVAPNEISMTAVVESVGDYWRFIITGTDTGNNTNVNFGIYGTLSQNGTSLSPGIGSARTIWGAQLNIGSTAQPYFPTTDRLNVPRLTYQNGGGGCPSLLLEKQSTNLATQSTITSFGSGTNDWSNGLNNPASINQTTGIDGTQNGAKYTKTAGETTGDYFLKRSVPVTSGTTYTISGYIKLGTASNAVIVINNTTAWDTVANGSIVCSTANGFSTTAWKRFELTITAPASNQINIHYGYNLETGVTAQATGTFFLDGLQVEAGSYATSLINTTSSSATRVADACSKTGISSLIGQSQGTLFVEVDLNNIVSGDSQYAIVISDGSAANRIQFLNNSGNDWQLFITANTISNNISLTTSTSGVGIYKIAIAYKSGDVVYYINGIQKGTSSETFTFSTLTDFDLGQRYDGLFPLQNPISQAALFQTRLTNAELASLTTL